MTFISLVLALWPCLNCLALSRLTSGLSHLSRARIPILEFLFEKILFCTAGRPYGGATILAKPIDIVGQNQVGKILAGTAVPADSFLIGTS